MAVAPGLDLRAVSFDHPDAVALIDAVQQVYVERYGGADRTPVEPGEFAPPLGLFVVGYTADRPISLRGMAAAISRPDDPELRDGDVELKRMYVADTYRGRGYARRLLAELERAAAEAGGLRMVLETGTRQPEAIALYRSSGYLEMGRFGVTDTPRTADASPSR
ncbi:MAG: GNAT family N-acetyltransferase [Actinomycetota bacterium]|nr:GNAT family N-acetyltransferase [Actinomycetota bacterium]